MQWCGQVPLYEVYLTLYSLTNTKQAKVAKVWMCQGGGSIEPKVCKAFQGLGNGDGALILGYA